MPSLYIHALSFLIYVYKLDNMYWSIIILYILCVYITRLSGTNGTGTSREHYDVTFFVIFLNPHDLPKCLSYNMQKRVIEYFMSHDKAARRISRALLYLQINCPGLCYFTTGMIYLLRSHVQSWTAVTAYLTLCAITAFLLCATAV